MHKVGRLNPSGKVFMRLKWPLTARPSRDSDKFTTCPRLGGGKNNSGAHGGERKPGAHGAFRGVQLYFGEVSRAGFDATQGEGSSGRL